MKRHRFTFFVPSLEIGGVSSFVFNLAKGFTKKGLAVDILIANSREQTIVEELKGIKVIKLKSESKFTIIRKLSLVLCIPSLFFYLIKKRPKVIFPIWYGAEIIIVIIVRLTSIFVNRPAIIFTIHSVKDMMFSFKAKWRQDFAKLSTFFSLRLSDKVVAVSQGVALDFSRKFKFPLQNIRVIYNPIIPDELKAKSQEPIDEAWFNKLRKPLIISVGRLSKEKNHRLLIQSFKILLDKIKASLLILGEGEERTNLENFVKELGISDYVLMPGTVTNPFKFMKNSDVFVLSSDFEGFSLVLVEALLCGTPIVSTDCPYGPREILDNGKYGKLVPMNDPEALANAILETIQNHSPKEMLQERAKEFSVEKVVSQYLELIKEIIE
ncbi:MAG: glycosyltransferase [archaeon]|nr:glycosyltransferase [Candidatus Rehaiarchaeum fermentans]